jgi:hypothetical protein
MGITDQRDIGLDEIDYVSAWILRLAVGMMVLGVVFAVLDRYGSYLSPSRSRRSFRMWLLEPRLTRRPSEPRTGQLAKPAPVPLLRRTMESACSK